MPETLGFVTTERSGALASDPARGAYPSSRQPVSADREPVSEPPRPDLDHPRSKRDRKPDRAADRKGVKLLYWDWETKEEERNSFGILLSLIHI